MRLVLVAILTFSTLLHVHTVQANENIKYKQQLLDISHQVLSLVKQREYENALSVLEHFSEKFIKNPEAKNKLSMTELRILTSQYDHLKASLHATSLDDIQRIEDATEFHLVVDAIYSEHQPVWKKMENSVMEPLSEMEKAIKNKQEDHFQHYFKQFVSKYDQLKPALEVDIDEQHITRLNSYISFLENNRSNLFNDDLRAGDHIRAMKADFGTLFDETTEKKSDMSLPWLILTIGGVIVSTLFYVGWIKYKAERKRLKKATKERHDKSL